MYILCISSYAKSITNILIIILVSGYTYLYMHVKMSYNGSIKSLTIYINR